MQNKVGTYYNINYSTIKKSLKIWKNNDTAGIMSNVTLVSNHIWLTFDLHIWGQWSKFELYLNCFFTVEIINEFSISGCKHAHY